MRGTALQIPSIKARESTGNDDAGMSIGEWRTFCQEVREAAEQLRTLASRAEAAAINSNLDHHDLMRAMAREVGVIGAPASPKANTFAIMMLGPFAALEELRRRIRQ